MGEIEFITFHPLHHQHLTDQFHTGDGDKHLTAEIKEGADVQPSGGGCL